MQERKLGGVKALAVGQTWHDESAVRRGAAAHQVEKQIVVSGHHALDIIITQIRLVCQAARVTHVNEFAC